MDPIFLMIWIDIKIDWVSATLLCKGFSLFLVIDDALSLEVELINLQNSNFSQTIISGKLKWYYLFQHTIYVRNPTNSKIAEVYIFSQRDMIVKSEKDWIGHWQNIMHEWILWTERRAVFCKSRIQSLNWYKYYLEFWRLYIFFQKKSKKSIEYLGNSPGKYKIF